MELDEYKRQTYQRFNNVFPEKSTSELENLLHGQVNSQTEKIKRSLRLEIIVASLFVLFVLYVLLHYPPYIKLLAWATLCFSLVFLGFFLSLYHKINAYYAAELTVRANVEQLITILTKFIRLYFRVTMIFIPLIFILAFFTVAGNRPYFPASISTGEVAIFATASAAWCILMYYFTRWYVHLLYGKHLRNLKEQLNELQNIHYNQDIKPD